MSALNVELHIQPPLSYEITKRTGGITIMEEAFEGETLRDLLARLETKNPAAFKYIYNADIGEIRPPIVSVVNGITVHRSEVIKRELEDGDKITWFFMYTGG